ncbi:hypothetical protein Gpo141_00000822 [Globisporangium polare]
MEDADGDMQQSHDEQLQHDNDHSHDDEDADVGTPPPILIPSAASLRRCRSSGSSCSSSSSATPVTSHSRCPSSSMMSELRNDRELITMVCSSGKSPESVEVLDLSQVSKKTRKALKSLRALAEFTNLVTLNASNNAIGSVDGVEAFAQLEALSVSRNHLKRIGSPLFTLTTLRHLDLSGNFISHIPKAIVGLEQLETLNLSGNNLSVLKEVDPLGALANLYECSFTANPFCKLPTYKDYLVCKLPSLEKLDDAAITALVRDKSRRRFSEEMFCKDSRLREAGIAHENEQNKLREARSALEAENLRLKGELQVKSKLLQNKSKEWSSATGQLLQLQQEIAMLNLDRRGSVSPPRGSGSVPGSSSSVSVSFSMPSPQHQMSDLRHSVRSTTSASSSASVASTSARLSESFARATRGSRGYDVSHHPTDNFEEEDGDLDFHLHQRIRSASPAAGNPGMAAAVSPLHPNLRYAPPSPLRSLSLSGQFDEEVTRSAVSSPVAVHETQSSRHPSPQQHNGRQEDHSSYSKRLIDSACSPLCGSSYSPQFVAHETHVHRHTEQEAEAYEPAPPELLLLSSRPHPIAVSPQAGRSKSFNYVRRAFSELSPQRGHPQTMDREEVNLAEDDAIKHDMSINRSIRFPTFEDDLACPAYEDEAHNSSNSRVSHSRRPQQQSQQHQRGERGPVDQLSPPPSRHYLAPSSPQRLLSSPSPSPRSKAQRMWKRQHNEFREQTFGNPSKSPLKMFIPATTAAGTAPSPIDRDMLARQIQALQSCKQSLVGEIAKEEQLLHALKQEANSYASQMDQLHLGIQVCLSQDAENAAIAATNGSSAMMMNTVGSPRRKQQQREEENYRAKLEFCRSKLRFAEDKEKEIEMTMVRTTKRVLQSDLQNTPFDKEIFALTHKLQQVIVQKEEIHQEMSRLMALMRQQQQQQASSSGDNDEAGNGCASPNGARRYSSGGSGYNSNSRHQQQTVDDMLEEEEQRQRLSAEHQQSVALSRKRLDELQRRHSDVLDRIRVKEDRIASFVDELKDVEKELSLISQQIPVVSATSPHPLRRQQRTRDSGTLQQQDSSMNRCGDQSDCASQGPSCSDAASSTAETRQPISGSPGSSAGQEGSKAPYELRFKELLTAEMLEEIKKDIYERLSTQLAAAASMKAGEESERSVVQDRKDLHEAIAAALETQMKLAIESFHKQRVDDEQQQQKKKNAQEKSKATASSPSPSRRKRTGKDGAQSSATTRPTQPPTTTNDTPKDDDIACDQLEDFVPVDATYVRKYRFVKYRSQLSPPSPTGGDALKSKSASTRASGAQRILKACERLEQAENDCKIDSISAIEVDPMGNKRSNLKVLLMGARDLPTSHLRTKNLDPYVSMEIIYPEHIVSSKQPALSSSRLGSGYDTDEPVSSANYLLHRQQSGQSFRSRTKKKTVYPVWDEDFEFAPVLSLKGYLHVRILNDRKLSREQLVGEVRIPLRSLLHQKKAVDWFPLRIAVPQASSQTLDSAGMTTAMRKTSTILRTSGGTIRLQLQLTYSRLEKYKRAVDELVTKFFHEHNQLPPFIEAAGGNYGMKSERRKQHKHNAHNQEQHNEEEEVESQDDGDSGDAMRRQRYAVREDAAALDELQYQQQQHSQRQQEQHYGGGVPEVESPAKDGESAMPTFDSWRAERGAAAAAAEVVRLRNAHNDDSSWGELSPQRASMDVMIASHIFDSGPLPATAAYHGSSETITSERRLSAERSRRLWESAIVPQESLHSTPSSKPSHAVHPTSGQASAEHSYFYPEPTHQHSSSSDRARSTFAAAGGSASSMVRHPSLANLATSSRSVMLPPAIATFTAGMRAAPSPGVPSLSRTPRAGNRRSQSYAASSVVGRRKTTGTSQRPECFDDYSPYHPDFKFTDVLDLGGGNNDHFAKRRKVPNLHVWQATASSRGSGGGLSGLAAARDDEANRKTDLRIFKSPGFARRQPTSGFPERYIGLDNQTCERLKRMFGRMDGGTAPG